VGVESGCVTPELVWVEADFLVSTGQNHPVPDPVAKDVKSLIQSMPSSGLVQFGPEKWKESVATVKPPGLLHGQIHKKGNPF
jgi:hypothetical protein